MIKLYSKPGCVQCVMTKKVLDKDGIPYEEVDVIKSPDAADALKNMGFTGVPVVAAPGIDPWYGFSPDRLRSLRAA